ncbi:unnamed protein product [Brassica oleracea var. botrytis]|uniref:BnaCnng51800D protein n=3 Tax=Brassica TaxID=3705 RepID=A0A078JLH4_BRANA|nr:hypothetical protein HID58_067898 [Brassica napus]CAF1933432.1 unnamed protein product [Brassica napus]CDY66656.1 BnaCnng51800D [Brassica napus]
MFFISRLRPKENGFYHTFFSKPLSFSSTSVFHLKKTHDHVIDPRIEEEDALEEEDRRRSVTDRAYWRRRIRNLCTLRKSPDEALRIIDGLCLRGYRPDSLNLSSVIHALCDAGRFDEAHRRCLLFVDSGFIPDERTCNVIIARLLDSGDPVSTLRVVQRLIGVKREFVPSLTNYNRLINQMCLMYRVRDAHKLVFEMRSRGHLPNVVTYTTLIRGYCEIRELEVAHKVFDEMRACGVRPNCLTLSVLIGGFLKRRDLEVGRKMMEELWGEMKDETDASVKSAAFANLVDSLCREGYFNDVFEIAEDMPQCDSVNVEFAYGHMMDSLCRYKRNHGAARIVYIMKCKGLKPISTSYNAIIHGLCKDDGCMRGYQLLEEGSEFGFFPSEYTYKLLVESLCKEHDTGKARNVLELMLRKEGTDRNRIYNIYLRALCVVDNPTEILNVLVSMLQGDCRPDEYTLNTVIDGFCKMGRVDDAMKVLGDMMTGKFCAPDAVTLTTVMCGLLTQGRAEEALDVLNRVMPENGFKPSVVTYNAVMRGLFKLRKGDEAMRVFDQMAKAGVSADNTTYAIIIDGLCLTGQVDTAKRFWDDVIWPSGRHDAYVYSAFLKGLCRFGSLSDACHFLYELADSGAVPNVVCYNIVIDECSRSGLRREAYQIIEEMRKNGQAPDAVTWRILDKLHDSRALAVEGEDINPDSYFKDVQRQALHTESITNEESDFKLIKPKERGYYVTAAFPSYYAAAVLHKFGCDPLSGAAIFYGGSRISCSLSIPAHRVSTDVLRPWLVRTRISQPAEALTDEMSAITLDLGAASISSQTRISVTHCYLQPKLYFPIHTGNVSPNFIAAAPKLSIHVYRLE